MDKYNCVVEASKAKSAGGPHSGHTLSRADRDWSVNALSFVRAGHAKLAHLGFQVGADLFKSVTNFLNSGESIYSSPEGNFPGRKRHKFEGDIANRWLAVSHAVGRKKKNGDELRTIHGGKAVVARSITEDFDVSLSTAYRYCPRNVVSNVKYTDLCGFCEMLRELRLKAVRLAKKHGLDMPGFDEFAGQNEVAGPGVAAADFLKNFDGDEDVHSILKMLDALSRHENLGKQIRSEMTEDYGRRNLIVCDFSANAPLRSNRGDAKEFYAATALSLLGVMCVVPDESGGYTKRFVDVFSHRRSHASEDAAASLKCAMDLLAANGEIGPAADELVFYTDKAKHFVSGEFAHEVLFLVSRNSQRVSYTFRACYRGKTELDGHFARTKERLEDIKVCNWPKSRKAIEKLVAGSYTGRSAVRATFLSATDYTPSDIKRKLIIPGIASTQHMQRVTNPCALADTLKIEDKVIPIKTCPIGTGGAADSDEENEGNGENEEDEAARELKLKQSAKDLCGRLLKQRRKLEIYYH